MRVSDGRFVGRHKTREEVDAVELPLGPGGDAGDGELTPEQQREGRERYEASREAEADRERWEQIDEAVRRMQRENAMEWPGTYEPGRQRFPKQAVEDMPQPFQVEARQPA